MYIYTYVYLNMCICTCIYTGMLWALMGEVPNRQRPGSTLLPLAQSGSDCAQQGMSISEFKEQIQQKTSHGNSFVSHGQLEVIQHF